MRNQFFKRYGLSLLLAVFPLLSGCSQEMAADTAPGLISLAMAEVVAPPAPDAADTNSVAEPMPADAELAPESESDLAEAEDAKVEPAPGSEKTQPANVKPSPAAAEIIKMAQSGVDTSVMMSYVTNSKSPFSLRSDEIIYLNDLGVPNEVITAMIQQDRVTKECWSQTAEPAAEVAETPAETETNEVSGVAPTYIEEPQAAQVQTQPANVTYNYFYDTLSPYGTWVNIDGYGLCWQPTVVVHNPGWRPYFDRGRWVYTDGGWYWLSDYTWGATTFHYGRWFRHARWGWCWWPDTVWAPSWVTWRYSSAYCGWAPLPPAAIYHPGFGFSYHGRSVGFGFDFGIGASWFTFVPTSRFCDPHPYHYRVPRHRAHSVFVNTTIINNYGSHNKTIVNHGIPPERIRAVAKTEIRKVSIKDAGTSPVRGARREHLDRNGGTLVVHRPKLPENRSALASAGDSDLKKTLPTKRLGSPRDIGSDSVKARPNFAERKPTEKSVVAEKPATSGTTKFQPPATRDSRPSVATTKPAPSNPVNRISPAEPKSRGSTERPTSPLIVRGKETVSKPDAQAPAKVQPTTKERPATSKPSVVIGNRNSESSKSVTRVAPTSPTRSENSERKSSVITIPSRPQSAPTYQWQNRSDTSSSRTRVEPRVNSAPSYSPPAPAQRPSTPAKPSYTPRVERPTYSAPASRPQYSAPAARPQYSAPAARPQYSAPAARPQSRPSYSAPSKPSYSPPAQRPSAPSRPQSAPSRSDSGRPGRK